MKETKYYDNTKIDHAAVGLRNEWFKNTDSNGNISFHLTFKDFIGNWNTISLANEKAFYAVFEACINEDEKIKNGNMSKTIKEFKTELKELIDDFNKSNECIIKDIDLNSNILKNYANESLIVNYDIQLKIK